MDNNKKPLWNLWNSLRQDNYDVPDDYESFEETLTAPGQEGVNNRQALYHSLRQDNYDVPDDYESFSTTLFAPMQQQAATGVAAQGTSQRRRPADGERIQATYRDSKGNITHADSTQLVRGKVATVDVEVPSTSIRDNDTAEQQAMQQRMSQVGEIYLEPGAYSFEPDAGDGKMHYSWRNGRRIGQLDPGALRFAHIGRNYSSEAYDQAEQEAAEMTDEQLIKAFNDLYNAYGKNSDNALTQGYGRDDASRMMAYATEMRYRDVGMGHARDYGHGGQPKSTGLYHYHAAKMDPAVSAEMEHQDKMSWDDRVAYLSDVLRDKQARENTITIGRATDEDRKALEADKRKLLAGSMLYARDNNRYPEEAYNIVVGAANNSMPTDTGFWNGFTSTMGQMWRDVKYFTGEAANLIADDRGDVIDAIEALDKYGEDAETKLVAGTLHNMGLLGMLMFDGDEAGASEGAGRMLAGCIVRGQDGRVDIDATRAALLRKLNTTYSWGDRQMRDNVYNTAMAKRVEGDAAWWGQQVAQLVPSAAAVAVGVTTRNPAAAQAIGQLGMGYMCISSGSQAMQEARLYGADENQVWTAGIVNAMLEYATEKIPFDRYTRRVFGEVKATSARRLMDAVADVNHPAHHEVQQLLEAARKELGNGTLVKAYTGDILAEGSSEFAAGTLQKASEILYKNPEDYPTFMEILEEGIEGFKGGAAMGGIMGGVSTGTAYYEADNRRKKAGSVTVGLYDRGDGMGVPIEIVGQDSNGNYVAIDGQHNEVIVKPDEVQGVTTYTYDEWKKGEAEQRQDQSFNEGYQATDEEQAGVKERLDVARAWLYNLGFDDSNIESLGGEMPEDWLAALSDEQREAVEEYRNAMAAYEGMVQHVQDDMEGAIAESEATVEQRTHPETGAVHRAELKTGGEVFIIRGNVALMPDNSIDIENSDGDLNVFDPATGGKRMIHISHLARADEPVMADQLKQEAAATIQETMATEAANRIDGVLPFQPGDVYSDLPFGEEQHTIQVIADGEDGVNVVVSVDGGEQRLMARQMIQEAADALREARIAEQAAVAATAAQPQPTGQEGVAPADDEASQGDAIPEQEAAEEEQPDEDTMPMNGDEVDWFATSPERGHRFLYEEAGLSPEEADAVVANSVKDAEKELEKVNKKAQAAVDYWKGVQAVQQQIQMDAVRAQAEERAARDAAERQVAIEAEEQYQAEQAAKAQEQAERGPFSAGAAVTEKWNAAPKTDGVRDQITLADGTAIAGHYLLVEAGAATPSHDPANGWKQSEGFPVDDNGGTVNDRDYERDQAAQEITIRMSETYDSRAAQSIPVVTSDGVVLSGNGRTIAGDLAAQAGTDGAYIDYLREFGGKYGFNAEQVGALQHPRVLFVPDDAMPYTPETFARFNAQEMKGQNLTETAVKLGKTVDDATFNDVVGMINRYDTMADFYADESAATQAINRLLQGGVINPMQFAQMFDGDKVSGQGKEMLENLLLGKAFEGNPDAIRQLTEMPSVRQQIVSSLAEIANNSALGDYSLEDAIAQAISLVYQARKGGIKQGDTVTNYARQLSLFPSETGATVADYRNAMVLLLGDILNGKAKNTLKYILTLYNRNAAEAASGQMDLFSGAVKDPETILKETIDFINQSSKNELKQEIKQATSERKAAAESGGEAEGGEQTEPATERSEAGRGTDAAVTEAAAQTDTNPSEGQKEAGNYRKGHVKIDGFDVTIEQPKGSVRSGVDASGKPWSQKMHNTYGYIRGTEGVDGDHIDVFLSDHLDSWNGMVYVVDQVNKDGTFDEHKVMYGFDSEQEAREAYLSNYEEGWTGLGNITGVSREEFKKWVDSSHRKTKPFAEYKSVRASGSQYTDNTSRSIQGLEGYTEEEILEDVRAFIEEQLEDAGIEGVTIKGMALHGSRMRGDARPDSDLDVVVEYEGDISEDAFFNLVNYDLSFRGPNGVIIDINPITRGKSGTLEQYMERSRRYDAEKRAAGAAAQETVQESRADGGAEAVGDSEAALRDGLIEVMRGAGIEVVTDAEEGQRVLDGARRAAGALDEMKKRNQQQETALPEDESSFKGTAISSADGAKVIQNLENLSKESEKLSTARIRTFLGDVADAIGATQYGSSSRYATFETVNGEVVTIRLADHNAHTSGFDNNGRDNGISIVISRKPNSGINNDGEAHLVEFFYSDKQLRKAEGSPYSDIVRSIQQALYSGEYKDTTGLAQRQEVNEDVMREHRVWHGSGAEFDAFDHSHMGEGEGAQAYGWGTYVTEVEGIGRRYAESASGVRYKGHNVDELHEHSIDDMEDAERNVAWMLSRAMRTFGFSNAVDRLRSLYKQDLEKCNRLKELSIAQTMERYGCSRADAKLYINDAAAKAEMWQQRIDALDAMREEDFTSPSRVLYSVEIPEDNGKNYLDWVSIVMPEQGGMVAEALARLKGGRKEDYWPYYWNMPGHELYRKLIRDTGSDRQASELLRDAGIVGIKYPANYLSGGNRMGSKNYVIFNEADARIVGKEKFFLADNGDVYGFVKDGKIYIDPRIATSETPVHEYTHLWCAALRQVNPAAWARLKEALLGHQDVVDHVKRLYPELEGDELMDEVFAHYSGRRGRERLQREQERELAKAKGVFDKARVIAVFDRIRRALDNFWLEARHLFAGKSEGLDRLGAEDFADMALADLLRGFNPTEEVRKLEADGRKAAQLRLVTNANAMEDTYHTGIRSIDDIKTYAEAVEEGEGIGSYPDFGEEDARAALERGRATVYSSHPIEPGSFVSMSRMEAEEYAGGGEVYSREVPLEDVAWLYANEGQYAPVEGGTSSRRTATEQGHPLFQKAGDGGRLAIIERDGKWRVEGMPGEFNSRYAAIDEWRERAAGNVVWYLSEDGDYIKVEGDGDMYEMISGGRGRSRDTGDTAAGRKQRERLARQQATRSASGRRMVDELAEKLGVKVRYVDDMSEQERAQFIERQLNSKGWYNPHTGEVFINLGRHTRLYDILSTFLHETVAHKGLRRLFGKDFNTFLDNVYNNVNEGIRAEIGRMAEVQKSRANEEQRARHDDEHWRRVATEEYMAKLAERLDLNHPEQRTLWEKIKGFLLDKLRKIGVTVADSLSDNDLRGILWESYHSMENEGVMGYAKGVAFRDQMEREANGRGGSLGTGDTAVAAEPQGQYTGSLFDMLPQAGSWARMMSNMSERELRNEIAKDGPNVTSSYSEEYDRRHIQEYNQECDKIQAQLERELPGEDLLLELLQDAEAQWVDGAYKDSRRTGVLAAIDTISRALDEERAELPRVEEDNLYRDDEDDTDDVDVAEFDAGRLTFEERITAGMLKAAADNRAAVAARVAAMRSLGGNLSKLRQAMARQREYDRGTVDSIVRLARSVMESGFFRAFSPYEVKRLMSLINHAAGREDITKQAGKVVDLLLKHQLLSCENLLHEQMRTRGSKLNSQGVEVQAGLDIEGQRMVGAMRHALSLDADALQERINNTLDRMSSPDQALADVAAAEYQGLLLAQQYVEEIKGSKQEENELRQELKNAKEDLQAGTITREQYNQFVAETENAIRENRLERVAAYDRLTTALGAGLGASVQRAKEWREAQRERVNEIRHNANSDLEGIPADEHVKPSWMQRAANWSIVRFFMKPLANFDYMLRMLGSKNVNGEGYLWQRFMGGWTEATEREWRNLRAAHKALDEKASEVFGKKMRWSDLFTIERKMPGMDVSFWDAGEEKIHHLTQGNLLYIYMVNKMSDGRMKLRKMGINEEDVEAIRQSLDPRFIELADWLQDEFLVNKRNEYNEVYQRMFGASMAAIEHYFPLKINSRSRGQEEDLENESYLDDNRIGSTITGSIIKRKRNSLPLDVTGADAFDVVLGHLQDMEHWAAFAEFNRDLNTLLSYKRFRNRLLNMSSVRFGSGKTLWMNFKRTCAIASGAYRPKMDRDSVDTSLVNVAKGVTAAKISFRLYTAMKQLLSYPAYLSEASGLELVKSSNPVGAVKAWNWALDELPGFAQRWQSRQAGDSRLRESDADWGLWRNKIIETASRWGMSPNAFIDGLTVAMGAKAIYETKLKRYRKAGYPDEQAKRRALRDASISYNETQQSNANAYLSAMQLDRSAASVALTVFRNASMGYQRRMFQAIANLKHVFTPGYKAQALEFMTKQMVRDGLSEQQAKQSAERIYRRAKYKNLADVAIFGWVMQMAWNLGPYIPYLLMGDDDDDKKEMLEDAALHAIAGGVEGLSGGNVMSDIYNMVRSSQDISSYNFNLLPLMSDIQNMKRSFKRDGIEGANDLVNLMIQAGVGVNPQTLTDWIAAGLDYADGNPELSNEFGMFVLRLMSAPQSQLDKLYIDELGMNARDAQKLNAGQMAERYARYKKRHGSPLTGWAYSEEGEQKAEERYMKRFETKVKERIAELDDEQLEDNFNTDDDLRRKWVGQAVAKRAGGTDSYGSPDTDYGVVYERKRDYADLAQDILLQVEKKKAKEAGDSDRYKALDRAQRELTNIKRGKHTTKVDEPGLGEGFDDEVMERLRERRRELLSELGIM